MTKQRISQEYVCGRCGQGPTGMMGHYTVYCKVLNEELREHHFCCPDDCELDAND